MKYVQQCPKCGGAPVKTKTEGPWDFYPPKCPRCHVAWELVLVLKKREESADEHDTTLRPR
jgi:hypothetical protein